MIVFSAEPLANIWHELIKLHALHWEETESYRHGQPFAPRLERYQQYERTGMFVMYTARLDRKLIGNLGIYFSLSMHTQLPLAVEDTLFLLPAYRKGTNAVRFMRYVEAECWKRGVSEITVTAKNDKVGRLMKHLGYRPNSVVYSKASNQGADSATLPLAVNSESSDGATRIST